MRQVSPLTREQLSEGAGMRRTVRPGLRVPVAPTRRAHQQFQKFLDPASDRSRAPPLRLEVQSLTTVPRSPLPRRRQTSLSARVQAVVLNAIWFFASWEALSSSQEKIFLPQLLGPVSGGQGAGRVSSLSQGHSQVVVGSRLWLLLPGVRNPFQSFCGGKSF